MWRARCAPCSCVSLGWCWLVCGVADAVRSTHRTVPHLHAHLAPTRPCSAATLPTRRRCCATSALLWLAGAHWRLWVPQVRPESLLAAAHRIAPPACMHALCHVNPDALLCHVDRDALLCHVGSDALQRPLHLQAAASRRYYACCSGGCAAERTRGCDMALQQGICLPATQPRCNPMSTAQGPCRPPQGGPPSLTPPQVLGPHRRAGVDRWRGHQPRHAGLAAPAHRGGAPGLRAVQRLHQVQHQVG